MIPSTKTQLLVAEDWTKIYQSFRNADFQSYDFDTLRRTMITYLRETYPEEFNDYIDSSEYIALVDLIAYLGQNLSFRIDLNARENFLETAQRKDSVLRLAQLISYSPRRNIPANGLLKITAINTTDNVIDANGINLANKPIAWNDPTNTNWYQQFISVMNSAMPQSTVFGKPDDSAVLSGISTQQYRINSNNTDLPIYTVNRSIGGISTTFEITGAVFTGKSYVYEQIPQPATMFSCVFRNANNGAGSANTGFFVNFRQGTLASTGFSVTTPVANEIIGINANNINNDDVWLWQLSPSGSYSTLWTKVDSTVGNNAIYNSVSENVRTFYAVTTRNNDQIDLNFADGSFGDLPKGDFRLFYRQSNGRNYVITPDQMSGINISIPYTNKQGQQHQLTLTLSLQYTVTNSGASETIASIKTKAPQAYYLQNRMITAEDYNIGPLTVSNNVLKVKSINRVSSGISKYYDLSDVTGKYSSTDIFAKDGILYKEQKTSSMKFTYSTRNDMFSVLRNKIEPIVQSSPVKNFYYDKYPRPKFTSFNYTWVSATTAPGQTTGYINNSDNIPVQTGSFSGNNSRYITAGAMLKFTAPVGYSFKNGKIVVTDVSDYEQTQYLWSKVVQVTGDGTNQLKGLLNNGTGPVIMSGNIPTGAILNEVIPNFQNVFNYALEVQIVNLCVAQRNFGLSFDLTNRVWYVIVDSNLNTSTDFSLSTQGDISNLKQDSSWLFSFSWDGTSYTMDYRATEYVFESNEQTSFYVDNSNKNYDYTNNTVVKDQIEVLGINTKPENKSQGLITDYKWQIDGSVVETDGYIEPKKVLVSFYDANNNGEIDNPDAFVEIVAPDAVDNAGVLKNFVFFTVDSTGQRYSLLADQSLITPYPDESYVNINSSIDGQLYYFYDTDVVKTYSQGEFTLNSNYFAKLGRANIKFHYVHNSGNDTRIDPSKTNIIDVYVLTSDYDTLYRNWLLSQSSSQPPLAPTSQSLEGDFADVLNPIKSISDTLIYHPAVYKPLFGAKSTPNLQGTFKAVRNSARITSDNDLKTRILTLINNFFTLDKWTFGQSFNFTELSTYILNEMTPDIVNFIIVPKNSNLPFGSLFEIACQSNEILISSATADDIEIIDAVTASEINAISPIITNTNSSV